MRRENSLRATLLSGGRALGLWLQSGEPAFAEIAALAGIDFFIVDLEHGMGDLRSVAESMRAAAAGAGTTGIVRVPSSEPTFIRRVLDAGAGGLLVPMVEDAAEARRIVDACRYPPRGRRGMAADVVRGAAFGIDGEYLARAHEQIVIALQIETRAGLDNVEAIAEVDGVDVIFVGPNDLSGALGHTGETGHPAVETAIRHIRDVAVRAGKPLGTVPYGGRGWAETFAEGFSLVAAGSDLYWFRVAAVDLAAAWRNHRESASAAAAAASGQAVSAVGAATSPLP